MIDVLDVRAVQRASTARWLGQTLEFRPSVGSTNAWALDCIAAAADPAALHGSVFLADEQVAGRGQRGRSWHSPAGLSISASAILCPPDDVPPTKLVAAVALGIAEGIEQAVAVDVGIKWPNDLWIGERKLAGILLERRGPGGLVVGFGVNVHQRQSAFPPELREVATSLAQHCPAVRRAGIVVAVLQSLESRLDRVFAAVGDAELEASYRTRSVLLGRQVRLFDADELVEGTVLDLSATGGLLLQTATGIPRHVRAEHAREVRIA